MSETLEGVGWISQVQQPDGTWISWTQWKERKAAEQHVSRLLGNERYDFAAGRIVRVDWTIIEPATNPPPEGNQPA